jgi:hypothetical protein
VRKWLHNFPDNVNWAWSSDCLASAVFWYKPINSYLWERTKQKVYAMDVRDRGDEIYETVLTAADIAPKQIVSLTGLIQLSFVL